MQLSGKQDQDSVKRLQQLVQKVFQERRVLATAMLALFAVALFAHALFGHNGWISYRQKRAEYQKLQLDLQQKTEENHRLEGEIKALKSDPKAIEKEAREQLRYAKPGEVIYLLPERPGQQAAAGGPQTEAQRR